MFCTADKTSDKCRNQQEFGTATRLAKRYVIAASAVAGHEKEREGSADVATRKPSAYRDRAFFCDWLRVFAGLQGADQPAPAIQTDRMRVIC